MIPANKYATSQKYRKTVCDWQTNVPCDRPLIVQLNGHDADALVATGQLLAGTVDGIDLNLGIIFLTRTVRTIHFCPASHLWQHVRYCI